MKDYGAGSDEKLLRYLGEVFKPEDAVLQEIRERSRQAGLPEIQVGSMDALHLEVLTRAVQLRPDGFLALHYLGEAYQALERREEAIAAYEAELRIRPQSLEVQRRVRALRSAGN